MPDIQHLVDGHLCFDLREGIPVTIVVVTRVMMIELRWLCPFSRSAECLLVPLGYDVCPVGIQGRHQQYDVVLQDLQYLGAVFRR